MGNVRGYTVYEGFGGCKGAWALVCVCVVGENIGVLQFESGGIKCLLGQLGRV